jgi:hypothetical protein
MNFVLLFLVLIAIGNSYNLVEQINLQPENVLKCEDTCRNDEECATWHLRLSQKDLKNHNNASSYECFLVSSKMKKIVDAAPHIYKSDNDANSLTGNKKQSVYEHIFISNPIKETTIAIDSTSLINFPQHFMSGCSYSIFLWVWIWRRKNPTDNFEAIFSTRELSESNPQHFDKQTGTPLLPSVLFNVGEHPDKFFFAASKDANGYYLGTWPKKGANVKYHTWMHIAVTVQNNVLNIYLDGAFLDYINVPFPTVPYKNQKFLHKCPYHLDDMIYPQKNNNKQENIASDAELNSNSSNNDFGNYNNNNIDIDNNNDSFHIKNDKLSSFVNNTIIQLGGVRGSKSTVGMVHDFVIVRNKALSASQIKKLIQKRPPPYLPTFKKLLPMYGVYNFDDFCPLKWKKNPYLLWTWRICPEEVCGEICFHESFFFSFDFVSSVNAKIESKLQHEKQRLFSTSKENSFDCKNNSNNSSIVCSKKNGIENEKNSKNLALYDSTALTNAYFKNDKKKVKKENVFVVPMEALFNKQNSNNKKNNNDDDLIGEIRKKISNKNKNSLNYTNDKNSTDINKFKKNIINYERKNNIFFSLTTFSNFFRNIIDNTNYVLNINTINNNASNTSSNNSNINVSNYSECTVDNEDVDFDNKNNNKTLQCKNNIITSTSTTTIVNTENDQTKNIFYSLWNLINNKKINNNNNNFNFSSELDHVDLKFLTTAKGKTQSLYKAAMLWMNDRNDGLFLFYLFFLFIYFFYLYLVFNVNS